MPDDQNQWWILPKKKKRVKLVKDGSREYSQAIHRMAKNYGVKRTRSQVICPTVDPKKAMKGRILTEITPGGYLYYKVTEKDLK